MAGIPSGVNKISLNEVEFGLDVPNRGDYPESFHRRVAQGQFPEEDRFKFWREWTMRSFHKGERLRRILDPDDLKAFRYHDAEGVDCALLANWGEAKLQPALSRSLAVSSANLPMTVTSDGSTLVVGLASSPWIKLWTNAGGWANATAVATSGAVTDLITDGTTMYAVRGGTVLTSTNAGANWTEVGSYTTATGVAAVNGELYVGKSDGVYNHTTSESITSIGTTVISGYAENVYFGKDCRLYRYDGRAAYLYLQLPYGFNITCLHPYRNVLLILGYYKSRSGYRGSVHYLISGSANHLATWGELDTTNDWRLYAAWGGDDEIFFPNPDRGGVDRYGMEQGGITGGPIWGAAGAIPFKSIATCEGYLFVGRYDNVAGTDGVYIADITSPSGAGCYKTSGWLTTADYDFDYPNEIKLFREVQIECAALATGQSIQVEYSLDKGSTYISLGVYAIEGGTGTTYTLDDVTGQSIKLRLTLASDGTNTPTLYKTIVKAAPILETKYMWYLRLLLNEKWGGGISDLIVGKDLQTSVPFTDDDGSEYTGVIIEALDIERRPDPDLNYAIAHLTLREV